MNWATCERCGREVNSEKSAFVVVATRKHHAFSACCEYSSNVSADDCVVHVNGDRECGPTLADFERRILLRLQLDVTTDISEIAHI